MNEGEQSVLAMEAKELRVKVEQLKKERDQLEAKLLLAKTALDGRLGDGPDVVEHACDEYVEAENALPDWCDGEDYSLSKSVASVVRQNEELEAKCHEMREALQKLNLELTPMSFVSKKEYESVFQITKHALSSDCSRGLIKVGELAKTIDVIKWLVSHHAPWVNEVLKPEQDRLQQLIERAKK